MILKARIFIKALCALANGRGKDKRAKWAVGQFWPCYRGLGHEEL